jgi:hypothetical protein
LHKILNEIQCKIKQEEEKELTRIKEYEAKAEKWRIEEENSKRQVLELKQQDKEILEKCTRTYLEKLSRLVISIFIVNSFIQEIYSFLAISSTS